MWCLLLLGFFTLARKSNLVVTGKSRFCPSKQLCRGDILVGRHGLLVKYKWSKTNQFGERILQIPVVAIANSKLCPLAAFKNMVRLNPAEAEHPAFVIKNGRRLEPVSYALLQKFIKDCVATLGLDPNSFSSHSLRRGGATWAFRSQVPGELIKVQGDWMSDAYLKYLEFSLQQRLEVSRCMADEILQLENEA